MPKRLKYYEGADTNNETTESYEFNRIDKLIKKSAEKTSELISKLEGDNNLRKSFSSKNILQTSRESLSVRNSQSQSREFHKITHSREFHKILSKNNNTKNMKKVSHNQELNEQNDISDNDNSTYKVLINGIDLQHDKISDNSVIDTGSNSNKKPKNSEKIINNATSKDTQSNKNSSISGDTNKNPTIIATDSSNRIYNKKQEIMNEIKDIKQNRKKNLYQNNFDLHHHTNNIHYKNCEDNSSKNKINKLSKSRSLSSSIEKINSNKTKKKQLIKDLLQKKYIKNVGTFGASNNLNDQVLPEEITHEITPVVKSLNVLEDCHVNSRKDLNLIRPVDKEEGSLVNSNLSKTENYCQKQLEPNSNSILTKKFGVDDHKQNLSSNLQENKTNLSESGDAEDDEDMNYMSFSNITNTRFTISANHNNDSSKQHQNKNLIKEKPSQLETYNNADEIDKLDFLSSTTKKRCKKANDRYKPNNSSSDIDSNEKQQPYNICSSTIESNEGLQEDPQETLFKNNKSKKSSYRNPKPRSTSRNRNQTPPPLPSLSEYLLTTSSNNCSKNKNKIGRSNSQIIKNETQTTMATTTLVTCNDETVSNKNIVEQEKNKLKRRVQEIIIQKNEKNISGNNPTSDVGWDYEDESVEMLKEVKNEISNKDKYGFEMSENGDEILINDENDNLDNYDDRMVPKSMANMSKYEEELIKYEEQKKSYDEQKEINPSDIRDFPLSPIKDNDFDLQKYQNHQRKSLKSLIRKKNLEKNFVNPFPQSTTSNNLPQNPPTSKNPPSKDYTSNDYKTPNEELNSNQILTKYSEQQLTPILIIPNLKNDQSSYQKEKILTTSQGIASSKDGLNQHRALQQHDENQYCDLTKSYENRQHYTLDSLQFEDFGFKHMLIGPSYNLDVIEEESSSVLTNITTTLQNKSGEVQISREDKYSETAIEFKNGNKISMRKSDDNAILFLHKNHIIKKSFELKNSHMDTNKINIENCLDMKLKQNERGNSVYSGKTSEDELCLAYDENNEWFDENNSMKLEKKSARQLF